MEDVEVAMVFTAYDNPEVCCTYILEFNDGLWFRNRMDHSLINPNPVRMTGISLCNDPFDPNRELGINIKSHPLFIPLEAMHYSSKRGDRDPRSMKLALGLR